MRAIDSPQNNRNLQLYLQPSDNPQICGSQRSTLTLFVTPIRTDHAHDAVAPNNLALAANAFHRGQHFHDSLLFPRHEAQPAFRRVVA